MKKRWLYRCIPSVLLAMIMALNTVLPAQCTEQRPTGGVRVEKAADKPLPDDAQAAQPDTDEEGPVAAQTEQSTDEETLDGAQAAQPDTDEEGPTAAQTELGTNEETLDGAQAEQTEEKAQPVERMRDKVDELVDALIDWAAGIMFPDMEPDEVRRFIMAAYDVVVSDEFQSLIAHPEVRELIDALFEKAAGLSRNNPELAKRILQTAGIGESVAELLVYLLSHREDLQGLRQMASETELGQLIVKALDKPDWSYEVVTTPPAAPSD